jgi:menaquinone-dependent protoporphyrinogen oxidase
MARILIAFGTTEGHTRSIVDKIAEAVRQHDHQVDVVDTTAVPDDFEVGVYDGFIIGGSIHLGKHQTSLRHFVHKYLQTIAAAPNAFFSVSMTAALTDEEHQEEARHYVTTFCEEADWKPDVVQLFAGALLYTQYDFFKRLVMKLIAKSGGHSTDASHDHVYTDWEQIPTFVEHFLKEVMEPRLAQVG